MDGVPEKTAETRANTDASLGAERASTDAATERTAATAQHVQDDLIDRDRVVDDERLLAFRKRADSALARERLESPAPDSSVVAERDVADDRKKAEREVTDAVLDGERQGADAVVEAGRQEQEAHHGAHAERRNDTDEQLSTERRNADVTAADLADTRRALVHNQSADLTERKRAEKALQETERQLRHAQKMEAVGMLAGGIAHDFNNILTVILSYGELLLGELTPGEPMHDDMSEICKAGRRAADLTRQLLMFSRQQVVEPKVLDLNDVLAGVDKMLQRILGADVELVSLPKSPLGRVCVDPGSIEQVIMNLVVNARDAMPTGGKLTIETANVVLDEAFVRAHHGAEPGPHVMLGVADTGVGMDPATAARIFEPFFTTKDRGKGTGLGLSTVFGIVQQSGGSVWVYSELGKGTTFKVYLPCVDAPIDSVRAAPTPTDLRGCETILLVEDDDQVRAVALAILRKSGYHVIEARHANEALLCSERHPDTIDLLLTDVVMPQMSGPELAKRLAGARPKMKVLCMSGYTDDSIVRHGVLEARLAFLQKPITPHTLTARVRDVLDGRNGRMSAPARSV
jgi:two-component system cell cycle sensor histidine kinase/response regulator CckA